MNPLWAVEADEAEARREAQSRRARKLAALPHAERVRLDLATVDDLELLLDRRGLVARYGLLTPELARLYDERAQALRGRGRHG